MASVAYRRVSSADQSTDRQLDGLTFDKEFSDKVSGRTINRPGLEECLRYLREGDILFVHSIDRLARNLLDLEQLVTGLNRRGVEVRFIKEGLAFSGGDDPMARLMFQMLGAFAEFERSLIKSRQREGIAAARAKGRHLGRKPALSTAQVEDIKSRISAGASVRDLAKEFGVSAQTVYQSLKRPLRRIEAPLTKI